MNLNHSLRAFTARALTTNLQNNQPQFCLRCAIHSGMVMEDSASTTYYIKQDAINIINVFMRMFVTRPVLLCSIPGHYRAHRNALTLDILMHKTSHRRSR